MFYELVAVGFFEVFEKGIEMVMKFIFPVQL